MRGLIALASGLLFGFGLLISGMANPAKVLGFLDLAGANGQTRTQGRRDKPQSAASLRTPLPW